MTSSCAVHGGKASARSQRSAFDRRQGGTRQSTSQRRSAPHLWPVHERMFRGCRAPSSRLQGREKRRLADCTADGIWLIAYGLSFFGSIYMPYAISHTPNPYHGGS